MVPAAYVGFLTASTQASAALIGLLFVAISLAPDRVFGRQAEAHRQAQALSAFTALANIFFISFATLIPNTPIGPIVTAIALVAVIQTLGLLALVRSWRTQGVLRRSVLLFFGSAAIYGGELALGIQLWLSPADADALSGLLQVLLGAYAVGLGRAWELLGAPRMGIIASMRELFRRHGESPAAAKPDEHSEPKA